MKPKNGSLKTSGQDYTNLLFTDSDSDVPDLKLPSLKGKKQKKRKMYKSGVSGDTVVCSVWVMLKLIVLIVLLATLVVLGVVTYVLMGQVADLRDKIQEVESRNQGAPEEFQKYHGQIQAINRTLQDIKSGTMGIKELAKNLSSITQQVKKLNTTTIGLKEGLEAAPELKGLPKRFETLTSSLAQMGSDIQLVKHTVDALEDFKKVASQDIDDLKNKVKEVPPDTSTANSNKVPTGVKAEEFAQFKTDTVSSMENLNQTVAHLSQTVDNLYQVYAKNRNELNNVTAYMDGLFRFVKTTQMEEVSSEKASNKSSPRSDTTSTSTTPKVVAVSSTLPPPTTQKLPESTTTRAAEPQRPIIKIKQIETMDDLKTYFNRWDRRGTGQIDPLLLADYLPDPPTPDQLKPFDEDNNDKYSLKEFTAALGFTSETANDDLKDIMSDAATP